MRVGPFIHLAGVFGVQLHDTSGTARFFPLTPALHPSRIALSRSDLEGGAVAATWAPSGDTLGHRYVPSVVSAGLGVPSRSTQVSRLPDWRSFESVSSVPRHLSAAVLVSVVVVE